MTGPRLLALVAGLLLAFALGSGSAFLAVRAAAPLDVLVAGPWQAWPRAGTAEGDPYSRARLARSGEIPLGSGEGLALFARTDGRGEPLRSGCDYSVVGTAPPARLWTLAVEHAQGLPLAGEDPLRAIGSDAILRRPDGSFEITVSARPQPGNRVSSAGLGGFRLVMRLYDTTVRTVTAISTVVMPDIVRRGCA